MITPGTTHRYFPMSSKPGALPGNFLALALPAACAIAGSGCSKTAKESAPVVAPVPVARPVNTYSTKFPLKKDPISEGGRWMDAKTVGLDWGNISTTPGLATKNGVQLSQVTDNIYPAGNPGMGFNEGKNGDYGITSFRATEARISIPPKTGQGGQ
jgi:hypothetical protein